MGGEGAGLRRCRHLVRGRAGGCACARPLPASTCGGGAMGRKLDPLREKRGPGRKARKQRGAEVELARFLPHGKSKSSRNIPGAVPPGRVVLPNRLLSSRRGGERQEEAVQPRAEEVRGGPEVWAPSWCCSPWASRCVRSAAGLPRGDWEQPAARRGGRRREEGGSRQVSALGMPLGSLLGPAAPGRGTFTKE